MGKGKEGLYIVRLYDGFDGLWMDVSDAVNIKEAERIWNEKTDNCKKMTTYGDIDYYRIFPADTKMMFSYETGRSTTHCNILYQDPYI